MNLYDEGSRLDLSSDKSSYPYVDELIHNIWLSKNNAFEYERTDLHDRLQKISKSNVNLKKSVDAWKNSSMNREQREMYYKPLLLQYRDAQNSSARQMNYLLQKSLEYVDMNSRSLSRSTKMQEFIVPIKYEKPLYKRVPRKIFLERFEEIRKRREAKRDKATKENMQIKEKAFNSHLNYELRVENFYQNLYTNYYRKEQTARLIYNCIISLNKRKETLINNELYRFYSDYSNRKREAVNKYIKLLIGKESFSKGTICDVKVSYSVALDHLNIDVFVPAKDRLFCWSEITYTERNDTIKYCDMSVKQQNEHMTDHLKKISIALYIYLVIYNGVDFCKSLNFYFRCPASIEAHVSFSDFYIRHQVFDRQALKHYVDSHFDSIKSLY